MLSQLHRECVSRPTVHAQHVYDAHSDCNGYSPMQMVDVNATVACCPSPLEIRCSVCKCKFQSILARAHREKNCSANARNQITTDQGLHTTQIHTFKQTLAFFPYAYWQLDFDIGALYHKSDKPTINCNTVKHELTHSAAVAKSRTRILQITSIQP